VPATVNVNFLTVVHKDSSGVVMGFPDVCKTPSPAGPIPIPYPNIAKSQDTTQGSQTVTMDGNPIMLKGSVFATSTGDEAGSAGGGVVSNTIKGKAEFKLYSFDVKVEGKNVPRLTDIMVLNEMSSPNTPPFPEVQPPLVVLPLLSAPDEERKPKIEIGQRID
jgi:Toxin PAAR-like domain